MCNNHIESSHSEKLLGLVVNEEMTWKDHLYGEQWRDEENTPGLIPKLSQRAGLLQQLVNRLSKNIRKAYKKTPQLISA